MAKSARHLPNDLKAVALPKSHRGGVGRDDKIELHSGETGVTRLLQRVLAHRAGDALSACLRRHHVTGIGHMIAQARLIGLEHVATQYIAIAFGDEATAGCRCPPFARLLHAEVGRVAVSVARGDHHAKHRPDPRELVRADFTKDQFGSHEARATVSSASCTRPRSELLIASVITTSTKWPINRGEPGKF